MQDDNDKPNSAHPPRSPSLGKPPPEPADPAPSDLERQALDAEFDRPPSDADLSAADEPRIRDPLESIDQELNRPPGPNQTGGDLDDFDLAVERVGEASTETHPHPVLQTASAASPHAGDQETDISKLFATLDQKPTQIDLPGSDAGDAQRQQPLEEEPSRFDPIPGERGPAEAAERTENDRSGSKVTPETQPADPGRRSSTQLRDPAPPGNAGRQRPEDWLPRVGTGIAVIALAGVILNIWLVQRQTEQIEQLGAALQRQGEAMQAADDSRASAQVSDAVNRLAARLDAMQGEWIGNQQSIEQRLQSAAAGDAALITALADRVKALEQDPARRQSRNREVAGGSPRATTAGTPGNKAAASTGERAATTGSWVISLASLSTRDAANRELERLKGLDINAALRQARVAGTTRYRLVVPGFATKQAAQREADRLQKRAGSDQIWIKQEGR